MLTTTNILFENPVFEILINGVMLLMVLITIFVIDPIATLTAVAVFGGLYGSLMLFFQPGALYLMQSRV